MWKAFARSREIEQVLSLLSRLVIYSSHSCDTACDFEQLALKPNWFGLMRFCLFKKEYIDYANISQKFY